MSKFQEVGQFRDLEKQLDVEIANCDNLQAKADMLQTRFEVLKHLYKIKSKMKN